MNSTKKMLIFSILTLIGSVAYGQFALPEIKYDEFKLVKDAKAKIHKGVYLKKGKIQLEAHYPIEGSIQSYCNRSNIVYDSVYIYYGKEMMQVLFSKNGSINKHKWKSSGRQFTTEIYGSDRQLQTQFTQYTELNNMNPAPVCSHSFTNYFVGIYTTTEQASSKKIIKNYDTGEFVSGKNNVSAINRELAKLKPIADQIVINNYGQKFFDQSIRLNYYLTGAYHKKSSSYHRNNGMPDIQPTDGWFRSYPDTLSLTYADFTYDIMFSEEERYSIIRIRLNSAGELIEGVDYSLASPRAFTKGLLTNPVKKLATKADVLKLAAKNGLNTNDKDLQVTLVWKEESNYSSKGSLFYEVIYNKAPKEIWGCTMYCFDKWVINPATNEIDKSGEEISGECAATTPQVKKGPNGKFGVVNEYNSKELISYNYDYIQNKMSIYLICKKGSKYGVISYKEEVMIPFEYDDIVWIKTKKTRYNEELCKIWKDGFYGLATKKGEIIEKPVYRSIKIENETIHLISETGVKKVEIRSILK